MNRLAYDGIVHKKAPNERETDGYYGECITISIPEGVNIYNYPEPRSRRWHRLAGISVPVALMVWVKHLIDSLA